MKTIEKKLNGLIPQEFGGEMNPELLEGCVNIADQHAIDFSEWLLNSDFILNRIITRDILEIYKKQQE